MRNREGVDKSHKLRLWGLETRSSSDTWPSYWKTNWRYDRSVFALKKEMTFQKPCNLVLLGIEITENVLLATECLQPILNLILVCSVLMWKADGGFAGPWALYHSCYRNANHVHSLKKHWGITTPSFFGGRTKSFSACFRLRRVTSFSTISSC